MVVPVFCQLRELIFTAQRWHIDLDGPLRRLEPELPWWKLSQQLEVLLRLDADLRVYLQAPSISWGHTWLI